MLRSLLSFEGLVLTLDLKKDDIISTISKTLFSQHVTNFQCHPAQTMTKSMHQTLIKRSVTDALLHETHNPRLPFVGEEYLVHS